MTTDLPGRAQVERTWKPDVAGTLNIVSGACFFISGICILVSLSTPVASSFASYVMYSMGHAGELTPPMGNTIIKVLAASLILPSLVSLLGGIYTLRRSVWGLALTGSISTLVYFIPLGIPAIILTALSRKEFIRDERRRGRC